MRERTEFRDLRKLLHPWNHHKTVGFSDGFRGKNLSWISVAINITDQNISPFSPIFPYVEFNVRLNLYLKITQSVSPRTTIFFILAYNDQILNFSVSKFVRIKCCIMSSKYRTFSISVRNNWMIRAVVQITHAQAYMVICQLSIMEPFAKIVINNQKFHHRCLAWSKIHVRHA